MVAVAQSQPKRSDVPWRERWRIARRGQLLAAHLVLLAYTALAIYPIIIVLINSVKTRRAIFQNPSSLPTPETFSLVGFETVFANSSFPRYFANSLFVVVVAVLLIMLLGAMTAFALSEYKFYGNTLLGLYMSIGIMIPIRLGSVSLIQFMKSIELPAALRTPELKPLLDVLGMGSGTLLDTLWALILVYVANGLPLAVFILSSFMQEVPRDLKDAARVDGASEYRIFALIMPLIRPALGTIAVFNLIPIWNDLWFPLILTSSDHTKTVTLGNQVFMGQFANDYNAVIASATISMIPIIIFYIIFSRQLIRGLTSGSVK